MAVQKSRKSPSKRGMRRAHQKVASPTLAIDKETGEKHRRHHITRLGYYRGRQVRQPAAQKETDSE